jgi:NAD(P)-dependent dehydrogenase (short-subunit alcohol dehydrogenase family)
MSKVLITGSAEGLGREAAKQLARGRHEVVLHTRDEACAQQASAGVPGAAAALPGDFSSITSTRALAGLMAGA